MLSEAQLAMRKEIIGASDIPQVLNLPGMGSALTVYTRKKGLDEFKGTARTETGNRYEPYIARWYSVTRKVKLMDPGETYRNAEHPWLATTPDRWIINDDGSVPPMEEREGLEIKWVGPSNAGEWGEYAKDVPPRTQAQCMWSRMATGARRWHVCALVFKHEPVEIKPPDLPMLLLGDARPVVFTIRRDDHLENAIFEKAKHFWFEHVLKDIPPEAGGSKNWRAEQRALLKLFPTYDTNEAVEDESKEQYAKVKAYGAWKAAEAEFKRLKNLSLERNPTAGRIWGTWGGESRSATKKGNVRETPRYTMGGTG